MALWCALYINDRMIGHASAQRVSGGSEPDDVNTYRAMVSTRIGAPWHGEVTHRYGDGGWELMRKVIEAAESAR
ncbi:hypothetical protein [Nocardia sp. NPDC057030]|uniref:hypothetical protein n=1 Tax=unclassified Nocardia TaxID=2637762 RepID=UPI003631AA45